MRNFLLLFTVDCFVDEQSTVSIAVNGRQLTASQSIVLQGVDEGERDVEHSASNFCRFRDSTSIGSSIKSFVDRLQ
jgi:hypothetical protein